MQAGPSMADEYLAIYLNDHLAGSIVALELLQHLERTYSGGPVERFAADLRADIEADRLQLRQLMERLGIAESRARQATAWMAEKMTLIQLRLDDWAGGEFRLFEALEALSLGIEGKKALWTALDEASVNAPALQTLDYATLIARAHDQRDRVEAQRMETATSVLTPALATGNAT
jgi:hypothetical protein